MSLIYSALRRMEEAVPAPVTFPAASAPRRAASGPWLVAAALPLALAAVTAAFLLRAPEAPPPREVVEVAPAHEIGVPAVASDDVVVAVLVDEAIPADAPLPTPPSPSPAAIPAVADDAVPPPRAAVAAAEPPALPDAPVVEPAPPVRPLRANTLDVRVSDTRTQARGGDIEARMTAFTAALERNDVAEAGRQLDALRTLLPARSLTLLRMRAWHALVAEDLVLARTLYRELLERVPNDENAGINLALLEARAGDTAAAQRRLAELGARHPDSPLIAQAAQRIAGAPPSASWPGDEGGPR